MFGRKKEPKKERKPRPQGSLAQYGIFEIPENLGDLGGGTDDLYDDDDGDLEAELAALTAGDNPKPAARKVRPKPSANLDKMIADSMKDINSDEELSGDDDDPDLLNELKEITNDSAEEDVSPSSETLPTPVRTTSNETMKLLEERLLMYKTAESKAKSENQSSKARRFNRGVKTLESLLKNSKLGHNIDTSEIPPVLPPSAFQNVTATQPLSAPTTDISPDTNPPKIEDSQDESSSKLDKQVPAPEDKPSPQIDKDILSQLQARQNEYKIAALKWKKAGNLEEALNYIKITKQFDTVIKAVSEGDTVDLSDMPPVPSLPGVSAMPENTSSNNKEESGNQRSTSVHPTISASNVPQQSEKVESLESALKERLEIYRRSKTVAETEGNSSKVRRYGRICKQFEDAIKQHMKGKAIAIDELPTPPGLPPLSVAAGQSNAPSSIPTSPIAEKLEPEPKPSSSTKSEEKSGASEAPQPKRQAPPIPPQRTNSDKKKKLTSRVDKQIEILEQRQKELKIAALKAKKEGDLDLARDYLRQAKGIDPLIQASQSGLPVDMNSIPLSPQARLELEKQKTESLNSLDESFAVIAPMECSEASGDDAQIYENLEEQLKKQIKWCMTTRDHCKALGDVASYNKWGRLALDYTKDLDMLRVRKRDNRSPPQHHYEMRTYSIVQSCTDLTDADIEISILRGINFTKETDTYVIFELPWPSESVSTDRTSTVRDTNNPEYNAVFPLTGIIDRKSRQMQRVFKRHSLKCQVWAKGCSWNPILCCTHPRGFFRADSLVGTATIKLQPLETQCILHDSFPLMDGRKAVGGKLEVQIRMRNPILVKQIEQNKDKWLIIDH